MRAVGTMITHRCQETELVRQVAAALAAEGLALHDCVDVPGLGRTSGTGGVCITPNVPAITGLGGCGALVNWAPHAVVNEQHDHSACVAIQDIMNCALADILRTRGFTIRQLPGVSALAVTGDRERSRVRSG